MVDERASDSEDEGTDSSMGSTNKLGLSVRNVTNETMDRLGLDSKNRGVQVTEVKPDSFADDLQMQPGMIILKINRQPVNTEEEFRRVTSQLKSGQDVVFLVRGGRGAAGNTLLSGTLP
jgi:serine protease Do